MKTVKIDRAYTDSYKEYDIQVKWYTYDKFTRKLEYRPTWMHWKFYKSLQSATDAIRDHRRILPKYEGRREYGNGTKEEYITIRRYRIVKREFI